MENSIKNRNICTYIKCNFDTNCIKFPKVLKPKSDLNKN